MSKRSVRGVVVALLTISVAITLALATTASATPPTKFVLHSQFGHEVNLTEVEKHGGEERESVCSVESANICQSGQRSGAAGGFAGPNSVAVGPSLAGNYAYIADRSNERVQAFTPGGQFVLMFGREVDETTKGDVCTKASGDKCQAGRPAANGPSGEIQTPSSVSVDQATGDVYVFDFANHRVAMDSPEGKFLWMIGGEVDRTKDEQIGSSEAERNLCTAASGDVCQAGRESISGTTPHGAFKSADLVGNMLAVGGPEGLLYVGDQGRVQEFNAATGAWNGELSLATLAQEGYVEGLAVDASGNLYVSYSESAGANGVGVRVFSPTGTQVRVMDEGKAVKALALDPFGRLAAVEFNESKGGYRGVLFDASSGSTLSEFHVGPTGGIGFNPDDEESMDQLYVTVATAQEQEVEVLAPVTVAVPVTGSCKNQTGTSIVLTGTVNPEGVSETKTWFQYGKGLVPATSLQSVTGSTPVSVEAPIAGLRPNESYLYRLVAEDKNFKPEPDEEPLVGETLTCETSYLPPVIGGETQSYFVTYSSADLFAELNPENADTVYRFEYAVCTGSERLEDKECAGVGETSPLESSEYRTLGVMQRATNLQPGTHYRYRLIAEGENAAKTKSASAAGPEGEFTTLAAPSPSVASGPVSSVTASSASLSGTVSLDGAPGTYTFQVGVYNGPDTAYGTVVSGAVSASEGVTVAENYILTGLQAGTTYAYRLVLASPYIDDVSNTLVGDPVIFTTAGLPTVLSAPAPVAMLPAPPMVFPKAGAPSKPQHAVKRKKPKKGKKKAKKGKKASKGRKRAPLGAQPQVAVAATIRSRAQHI